MRCSTDSPETPALDKIADGLRDLPLDRWPDAEELAVLLDHTATVALRARRMKRLVWASTFRSPGGKAAPRSGDRGTDRVRKPFDPRSARGDVAAAGMTAKNFRDLPRTLADTPPTEARRQALQARLGALEAAAQRLTAVIRWRDHDH